MMVGQKYFVILRGNLSDIPKLSVYSTESEAKSSVQSLIDEEGLTQSDILVIRGELLPYRVTEHHTQVDFFSS